MCTEFTEELTQRDRLARELVAHLNSMGAGRATIPVTSAEGHGYSVIVERNGIPKTAKNPIWIMNTKLTDAQTFLIWPMDAKRVYRGRAIKTDGATFILESDGRIYSNWNCRQRHVHEYQQPTISVATALLRFRLITQEVFDAFKVQYDEHHANRRYESDTYSIRKGLEEMGTKASPEILERINAIRESYKLPPLTEFPEPEDTDA